jgi:hypothetical protein
MRGLAISLVFVSVASAQASPDSVAAPAPTAPTAPAAPTAPTGLTGRNRAAWLFVAGSVALVTVGGALAYSASSAENDVSDLYIGLDDRAPAFDPHTQKTYDDLVAQGERLQRYAWLSFGLAGASAVTAGVLFWHGRHEPLQVTPTASPSGAGVAFSGRF